MVVVVHAAGSRIRNIRRKASSEVRGRQEKESNLGLSGARAERRAQRTKRK